MHSSGTFLVADEGEHQPQDTFDRYLLYVQILHANHTEGNVERAVQTIELHGPTHLPAGTL